MDIKIKAEPTDITEVNGIHINQEIKQESELIIESEYQWLPTKLEEEQNEYYHEFVENSGQQEVNPKNEEFEDYRLYDQYNMGENEDYTGAFDYDDDYFEESENVDDDDGSNEKGYKASEYNLDLEQLALNHEVDLEAQDDYGRNIADSDILCKFSFNKWLINNYVKRECIACNQQCPNYNEWRKHIEITHKDVIKESEANYEITDKGGTCKKCKRVFVTDFARYLHTIKHNYNRYPKHTIICKLCRYNSPKTIFIQKHILKEHPEAIDEFKKSGIKAEYFKCPICCCIYSKYNQLWFHFMHKHPEEYKEKFRYNCHLCSHDCFCTEDHYLQHIVEKHQLNSWEVLNYRNLFKDKEYYACNKCHRVFITNDKFKLLKHFLEHESNCYWSCKFCLKNNNFKDSNYSHMCMEMKKYYRKQYRNKGNTANTKTQKIESLKLQNLQEFEEYVVHVCPFCNKEFYKMIKWQQHLRKNHEIDKLKGLEMKVIPNDSSKLCCVLCFTAVPNSPLQLHTHRFQHLPYKPYKCLHCTQTLSTFKIALNHVLKRCNDEEDRDYIKSVLVPKIIDPINCVRTKVAVQCPFCNYQKFPDDKSIQKHYVEVHNNFEEFFNKSPGDNTLSCKVCLRRNVQHDHVHNHFDEKFFSCPLCMYSFVSFKSCYSHLLSYHFAKPLNEQESLKEKTNALETSTFLIKKDMSMVPQLAKPGIKTYVLNEFAEFITFACPECNEGMSKQEDWHRHITTQHNFFDDNNLFVRDNGSVKCPTCKLNMSTCPTQQQKHKLTHMPYRSFICNLCYSRCNSLGVLYGHFRRKHFAQGTFKCPICPEVLPTAYQSTEHLKQIHPRNEWPNTTCLICYKILSSKSALHGHMATHDGERFKYTCDICHSKIIGIKDFNYHMTRHEQRGEVTKMENTDDDIFSHSVAKVNKTATGTNNTEQNIFTKDEYRNENESISKRKSLTRSLTTKKMKTGT